MIEQPEGKERDALALLAVNPHWRAVIRPWLGRCLEVTEQGLRLEEDLVQLRWRQAEARQLRELLEVIDQAPENLQARNAGRHPIG
ncbi:hypothetical protein [Solidesulfovibrio sp.]|uniref:hypothetical protein n=1 Tax=Solidesulfovibrio sp. TaxID=2910990 RepID=UPI002B212457|nr:hypothetical protein [Solidesulfovibrio sp.]MEA4857901.1 hypothetical protein [Solidesulfovibrio sp.]